MYIIDDQGNAIGPATYGPTTIVPELDYKKPTISVDRYIAQQRQDSLTQQAAEAGSSMLLTVGLIAAAVGIYLLVK